MKEKSREELNKEMMEYYEELNKEMMEYYGEGANRFKDYVPQNIKVGDSFDAKEKRYGISPSKRTIENHRHAKAKHIENTFREFTPQNEDEKNHLLYRFETPTLHPPYQSQNMPPEVWDTFAIQHAGGVKTVKLRDETGNEIPYTSPFMSATASPYAIINTDIDPQGEGDPMIRNYVLDRASHVNRYDIPKTADYMEPNAFTRGLPGQDLFKGESTPLREAEYLINLERINPKSISSISNPLLGQIEPSLRAWLGDLASSYKKTKQEMPTELHGNIDSYFQRLGKIPTDQPLSGDQQTEYKDIRQIRDKLHKELFERVNAGKKLYSEHNNDQDSDAMTLAGLRRENEDYKYYTKLFHPKEETLPESKSYMPQLPTYKPPQFGGMGMGPVTSQFGTVRPPLMGGMGNHQFQTWGPPSMGTSQFGPVKPPSNTQKNDLEVDKKLGNSDEFKKFSKGGWANVRGGSVTSREAKRAEDSRRTRQLISQLSELLNLISRNTPQGRF